MSERFVGDTDVVEYRVVLELNMQSRSVVADYAGDLSPRDLRMCWTLAEQMQHYQRMIAAKGACDFLALNDSNDADAPFLNPGILRFWAEYGVQVSIYAQVADGYLAGSAESRFSPDLSLDFYRKALSFHDFKRGQRFLDEDIAVLESRALSKHHRETLNDALFHLARRMGLRSLASERIKRAWQANPNADRTGILLADAAYFKQSENVILYATHLRRDISLTPRQLGQLAVAYGRTHDMAKADEILGELKGVKSPDANRLAQKIETFLADQRHG